jgi:hypothetical protein
MSYPVHLLSPKLHNALAQMPYLPGRLQMGLGRVSA